MLPEINNSKEVIKNRMLKHALNFWGIKNTDDLDPAVKLMLEALANELYNLGNDVKDAQVRILEKVSGMLAPDFLTTASPAHAVMYAAPIEPVEQLTTTSAFVTQRKIASRLDEAPDTDIELYFTPTGAIQLYDAEITHIATGGNLYGCDKAFNKQLIARPKTKFTEPNTIWLGLKLNDKIEDLQGLYFYFDWKNTEHQLAQWLYQLLPLAAWHCNNSEIVVAPGLTYSNSSAGNNTYGEVFPEYDLLSLIEKDTKNYYDSRYISLNDSSLKNPAALKQVYPAAFRNYFADNELAKLKDNLLWLKIVFPASMQQEYLDDLHVHLNAFPVMNRRLNDLKYRLKGGSHIMPLKTEEHEHFLSVKSLTDETNEYKAVPYRDKEEEKSGHYTLRNGGVERFDSRNAKEMISYLLELLRSESAAFSMYGYDFIATTLKEMNQKIALMEQKTRGNAAGTEAPHYIIVKPFEGQDMMYAEYWTTLAEAANNLRAGQKLQLAKGVKVKADSVTLLTTTTGGRNRLRPEERLNAFRYSILTRNRIVTKEDIRSFCFYELGNRISQVDVDKGIEMSPKGGEAFRRTIDILLTVAENSNTALKEQQLLSQQLLTKLQLRSGISNYYRIVWKE
ncbi:type VI secretion system baseplate subunit TssF [Foetidibacter luteolus]|uniref:type VI secretion system baseplate subunit TssF n=1 Tax=Foetidibacter luteolus TaxID=2608880 RepID=UPI00129A2793|nr:type VI secretion system baseplate subunit TssF [Foetidibacter luteolus]